MTKTVGRAVEINATRLSDVYEESKRQAHLGARDQEHLKTEQQLRAYVFHGSIREARMYWDEPVEKLQVNPRL